MLAQFEFPTCPLLFYSFSKFFVPLMDHTELIILYNSLIGRTPVDMTNYNIPSNFYVEKRELHCCIIAV